MHLAKINLKIVLYVSEFASVVLNKFDTDKNDLKWVP